ncbi:MAG: type II toxin-antitoxin system VapC family toxin [Desulfobacteraceae bacterium]|nr:MAG: type II toxin-antitoxin system VapC family toxin [Desulfobacteraceae bacterium]
MGQGFLIDTNILIYYYEGLIPGNTVQEVERIFRQSFNISIISRIEFLGWSKFDEEQYQNAVRFLRGADVISLSEEIVTKTIRIRRERNIKLPDAVIAAACLVNDFTLVTRNQKDFESIPGLKIYNPFQAYFLPPSS